MKIDEIDIEKEDLLALKDVIMKRLNAFSIDDNDFSIGTGTGPLVVSRLQLEGRQAMSTADFLRGQPDIEGATLGR